jgi:hemoglobin
VFGRCPDEARSPRLDPHVDRATAESDTGPNFSPDVSRTVPEVSASGDDRPVEPSVYDAAGGAEGMRRLAGAWHARVMADEVVSHAFGHGFHPDHTERLAAYWGEALGGPATYSRSYGDETTVVRMHSGNGPHDEMDRRAVACFDQALLDAGLADDARLRRTLRDYFAWATTTTMSRYHDSADDVPDGLRIPRWSWDGLVGDAARPGPA